MRQKLDIMGSAAASSAVQLRSMGEVNEGLEMEEQVKSIDLNDDNFQEKDHMKSSRKAIVVQNAFKKYGPKEILTNLNMTVPEGSIYALLGASGCGKTTLLSCILNLKTLDKGTINIFGYTPGTPESGVPGNRVGFMPQDLSLFSEFSIKEVIFYFGRIFGMHAYKIHERMVFILKLLKLPEDSMLIRDLSGGQQRRVSFAVSLIHEAQILILDEPTVGVDPLLRECIWDYLNTIARENKTTILITTHYIEEANSANYIGIMRNGRLLAEDSPQSLKEKFNCTLDEIVMELCLKDENKCNSNSPALEPVLPRGGDRRNSIWDENPWEDNASTMTGRIKALVIRNFIRMWRNIGFVFFLLFFPGAGVFFVCLAVGGDIENLNFGIVARETGGEICPNTSSIDICGGVNVSCHFFDHFPKDSMIWKYYAEEDEALADAEAGLIWGYVSVKKNFSEIFPYESENKFHIFLDATNQLVTLEISKNIHDAYKNFTEIWFDKCSTFDVGVFEQPVIIDEIFGDKDAAFTEFVAPSVHLILLLFMAVSLTGLVLILEKKAGMYERSIVAGVTQNEIVVSHFLSQWGISIIQSILSLIILFYIFNLPVRGPILGVIAITLIQATIGILIGFLISTICNEESSVLQLSIAIVMPLFMLSGVIWPLEGMPTVLMYISYVLPQTLAGSTIRSIMNRGWGFTHSGVWPGFVVSFGWIFGLMLAIFILNKYLNRLK